MTIRVVTEPVLSVLTLEEAKSQLRLEPDYVDEDDEIDDLIGEAQALVERETQRRFITQTLEWVQETWRPCMVLPLAGPKAGANVITVESITYVDLQGDPQTLDPTLYWVRPAGQTVAIVRRWFAVWPWLGDGAERVVVRFTITGAPSDAPKGIRRAMKLLVAHWYRNREAVVGVDGRDSSAPLPLGVEQCLDAERWAQG